MGKIFDAMKKSDTRNRIVSFVPDKSKGAEAEENDRPSTELEAPRTLFPENYHLNKNLVTVLKPQSYEAEQFKLLKTNILFPAKGNPQKVIMITSAIPGEGKSFVAANLAISISQNIDEHVLLMDCDLRLPTIHKLFGLGECEGLSEYLTKKVALASILRKTSIKKLTILPGGNPPHNPAELLSSEMMANLITEVKERYKDRFIIIDSAPPQLTSESNALAKKVDGILLVVNHGITRRSSVKDLVDLIGREKIMGVIFNRYNAHQSSPYFGYGKFRSYTKYYHQK